MGKWESERRKQIKGVLSNQLPPWGTGNFGNTEETSNLFHSRDKDSEEYITKILKVAYVSVILWHFPLALCLGKYAPKAREEKSLVCRCECWGVVGWALTASVSACCDTSLRYWKIKSVYTYGCLEECLAHGKLWLCAGAFHTVVFNGALGVGAGCRIGLDSSSGSTPCHLKAHLVSLWSRVIINKHFCTASVILFISVSPTVSAYPTRLASLQWKQPYTEHKGMGVAVFR